jgi:hypothetical protein
VTILLAAFLLLSFASFAQAVTEFGVAAAVPLLACTPAHYPGHRRLPDEPGQRPLLIVRAVIVREVIVRAGFEPAHGDLLMIEEVVERERLTCGSRSGVVWCR